MSGIAKTSIARKVIMALSGLFLVLFLALHVTINLSSVISPETFNTWSHFMGYNPVVQFLMQQAAAGRSAEVRGGSIPNAAHPYCRGNCAFCDGYCAGIPKQQGAEY